MNIEQLVKDKAHRSEKTLLLKVVRGAKRYGSVQLKIDYLSEWIICRNTKWILKVVQKYADAGAFIVEETDGNPYNRRYSVNIERFADMLNNTKAVFVRKFVE